MMHWHFFLSRLSVLTWKNLKVFRTRVMLTICGILFGIVSVISTFTVNGNMSNMVAEELKKAGTNTLILSLEDSKKSFKPQDVDALKKYAAALLRVTSFSNNFYVVRNSKKISAADGYGVEEDFFTIKKIRIQQGRGIIKADENQKVVVIGFEIKKDLFGEKGDVLGKVIWLGDGMKALPFRVVGVLPAIGSSQLLSSHGNPDYSIYLPYSTMRRHLAFKGGNTLLLQAKSEEVIELASQQVIHILKTPFGEKNLKLSDPREEIKNNKTMIDRMVYSGLAIGLLCLLSGGIGIMNIMLVSVMQRRREIGLYKSIGFSDHLILFQFLSESLAICLLGSFVGILVGVPGGSFLSSFLLNGIGNVSMVSIFISVFFSIFVGVVFGYLPAKRAAELDPIEALRG